MRARYREPVFEVCPASTISRGVVGIARGTPDRGHSTNGGRRRDGRLMFRQPHTTVEFGKDRDVMTAH